MCSLQENLNLGKIITNFNYRITRHKFVHDSIININVKTLGQSFDYGNIIL